MKNNLKGELAVMDSLDIKRITVQGVYAVYD